MNNLYEIKSSQGPGKFVVSTLDGFAVEFVLPPKASAEQVNEAEAGAVSAVRAHNAAVLDQLAEMNVVTHGKSLKELRHLLFINRFPRFEDGRWL